MTHILLIEDDELLSRMYKNKLTNQGFAVTCAFDGEDGLAKIFSLKPDLVLLDIMMPKLNGQIVLARAKENPTTKNIPIIILTNLAGAHDAQTALLAGAKSYIIKSDYTPTQVVERIKEILSVRKTQ